VLVLRWIDGCDSLFGDRGLIYGAFFFFFFFIKILFFFNFGKLKVEESFEFIFCKFWFVDLSYCYFCMLIWVLTLKSGCNWTVIGLIPANR
jgi:hypothetical protein